MAIKIKCLLFCFLFMLLLIGCATESISTLRPTILPTITDIPVTVTTLPTETAVKFPFTATPAQEVLSTLTTTITPSCVALTYEEYAQVEIFSPMGIRVFVDVYDPGLLSEPATAEDILLTTHTHWDHVNKDFQESFPGKQLVTQTGAIEAVDVKIQGIASAHNAADILKPEGGTNYIYLIETGGLRIAHFGDIGQDALTTEQLDLLGDIDIAITQLANPYSDMSAENRKGITLMEHVRPRLIIPTHINLDSAKLAVAQWQGLYTDHPMIELCASYLADEPKILFLGQSVLQFVERLNLTKVEW
jgi:hypothetical protein